MKKPENVTPAKDNFSVATIGWLFAVIVLLQFTGLFIPSHLSWGFNYWQLFPVGASVASLGFVMIIMSPLLRSGPSNAIGRVLNPAIQKIARWNRPLTVSVASILLLALFYFLRSRAHVYGDGYLTIEVSSTPMNLWPFSEYFMKPLSMLLFHLWTEFLSPVIHIGTANLLSLLDAGAGVIAFWALFRLSRLVVTGVGRQWFLLFGSFAGGGVILFFGYIEYYPPAVSFMLVSLACSIGYVKHKNRLWPALLTGIVATGFHFFAFPALALAVVVWWISPNSRGENKRVFSFLKANIALVLLSVAAAIVHQISYFQGPVLAVWPATNHGYWAFGSSHLLDIVNEVLLVAPLGLIALALAVFRHRRLVPVDLTENMLLFASLFLFLLAFWINPELGAARDWDLLSFFGIPFSTWGAYSLLKQLPETVRSSGLVIRTVVLCLVLLVPNLYEKNHLEVAANRLDDILWRDPHYQGDYREAYNSRQWAAIMTRHVGNIEKSIRYLKRSAEAGRPSSTSYATLATMFDRIGRADSAYVYYRKALDLDPGNERILLVLSGFEQKANRPERLKTLAQRAVEIDPGSGENHYLLSIAFSQLGTQDSALVHARAANNLKPNSKAILMQLGMAYGMENQHDSANYYFSRALDIAGPEHFGKSDYEALFTSALKTGRFEQARQALQAIERLQPGATVENNSLRTALDGAMNRVRQGK